MIIQELNEKYGEKLKNYLEIFYEAPLLDYQELKMLIESIEGIYDIANTLFSNFAINVKYANRIMDIVVLRYICFSAMSKGKTQDNYILFRCKELLKNCPYITAKRIHQILEDMLFREILIDIQCNFCDRYVIVSKENFPKIMKDISSIDVLQRTNRKINLNDKIEYAEGVFLHEKQYNDLVNRYGKENTDGMLQLLSSYKLQSGRKYASDFHAILNWTAKAYFDRKSNNKNNKITGKIIKLEE